MDFAYRDETRELDELTRKEVGGCFVRLPDGFTHYELSHPEAQETVVLVHGFSVPCFIYDRTFPFLTRAGFRVLRYDLFGRGFSDRPAVPYDLDLFVRQLRDLLDALGFMAPVNLVGLSAGGPVVALLTKRFPERVSRLVLIDPVGVKPFALSRLSRIARIPLLGEALVGVIASRRMARLVAASRFDRERIGDFGPRYLVPMQYRGFKRALLSSVRHNLLEPILPVYEQVGKLDKPVLLLWGRQDRTVPFRHSRALRAAIPHMEFHAIEGSGHIPHHEKPDEVNPILWRFLSNARPFAPAKLPGS